MSRAGPRPAPPCSLAHCRSSLVHTLHFFLEAAGLDLADGNSGNAEAGTAGPLWAAGSRSCCCWSHSNSLSSSSSRWWSETVSPEFSQVLSLRKKKNIKKITGRAGMQGHAKKTFIKHLVSLVVPVKDELPEQQQEQVWQLQSRQQSI